MASEPLACQQPVVQGSDVKCRRSRRRFVLTMEGMAIYNGRATVENQEPTPVEQEYLEEKAEKWFGGTFTDDDTSGDESDAASRFDDDDDDDDDVDNPDEDDKQLQKRHRRRVRHIERKLRDICRQIRSQRTTWMEQLPDLKDQMRYGHKRLKELRESFKLRAEKKEEKAEKEKEDAKATK